MKLRVIITTIILIWSYFLSCPTPLYGNLPWDQNPLFCPTYYLRRGPSAVEKKAITPLYLGDCPALKQGQIPNTK